MTFEVAARTIRRFDIRACKYGYYTVRNDRMFQRHADCWPRETGGASADGVNDNHDGAFGLNGLIDFFGCASFLNAETCQILAHRFYEHFWIWHAPSLTQA